jgi:hypothetical protein
MRYTRCGVKQMRIGRRRAKKISVCCPLVAVVGILLFNIGPSNAQESAPSDVYVAPQRFYVQKLAEME